MARKTVKGCTYVHDHCRTWDLASKLKIMENEKGRLGGGVVGESGGERTLLINSQSAQGTLKKPPRLVKAAFELKLMSLAGFEPLADACAYCGAAEPEAPLLDVREGVLRCKRCGNGESGLPLSTGSLAALRRVIYGDARRLYSFTLAAEDLKRLGDAAEAYVHTTLERGFQTLDFYKSLQKLPEGLS